MKPYCVPTVRPSTVWDHCEPPAAPAASSDTVSTYSPVVSQSMSSVSVVTNMTSFFESTATPYAVMFSPMRANAGLTPAS